MKKIIVILAILVAYGLGMMSAFKLFEVVLAEQITVIIRVMRTDDRGSP